MSNRKYEYPIDSLHAYRTKFDMSHTLKGSFNHGLLIPFDVIEVLPGDTIKIDVASIIRMSTPIAPIMDNIHMFLSAWFIPNRLVYDNWEQLQGANKDGAWIDDANTYVNPTCTLPIFNGQTIADYMGLPVGIDLEDAGIDVSALPGRGYALLWNENFRSEVVSAPLPIDHSSNDRVLVSSYVDSNGITHGTLFYNSQPLPLGKYSDYFTKALPQPIKHDPIPFIPDLLPVMTGSEWLTAPNTNNFPAVKFREANSGGVAPTGTLGVSDGSLIHNSTAVGSSGPLVPTNLFADVSGAWNTIEAIRVAFQLDKFYWKDGAYGSRYWEILEGHFKVTNKTGVLQLPQKLGELRWRINVDQVLSTAGYSADDNTTVGAPGANSVTTQKGSLFTFSVTEHGYIYIVGGTRHDHTYGQGVPKHFTRSDRLDYYDPVFANIGEQPVKQTELFVNDESSNKDVIFGYQEAWAEYRYIPDRTCGLLNPSTTNSLDFWTLADKFAEAPILNDVFIYENRNSLSRALVTGSEGPDFIFDMFFKTIAVREMPLFSIPGLVDHH